MKVPRNVNGKTLIKKLKPFGYKVSRQVGSHIRLTTERGGEHKITIPNHNPIKVGTLSVILSQIATHLKITKEELLQLLFD